MSVALALLLALSAFGQMAYDPGDWTSVRDFRYARALDATTHELFVATSGGILEYQLLRKHWLDPMVIGYGLSEAVEIDDPMVLLYDEQTGYLWVATRTQVLRYDLNADRWHRVERNLWGPGDRPVDIGVGGNEVYIETIPSRVYSDLFYAGSPLPREGWTGYITRYKGTRNFGGFMIDAENSEPPNVRWRGLRGRVPLTREQLSGNLGMPPVYFPSVMLPPGWVLNSDGTLLDPYLRACPVTDWILDGYGSFWATFWGGGVFRADLRMGTTEFVAQGPAGNDIRALLVTRDDVWMGGLNSGDRRGITRASTDFRDWKYYETRSNLEIRSTDVLDIASWKGRTWFATPEGVLSYEDKNGGIWKHYGVPQNLQSDDVRAVLPVGEEMWIGTVDGVAVMTLPKQDVLRVPNAGIEMGGVTRLARLGDTLYIGTEHGLYSGPLKSHEFSYVTFDPARMNSAVAGLAVSGDELWIANAQGVEVYNSRSGETKGWFATDWLKGAFPSCIAADAQYVWVGTRENGFFRYRRKTGEWIQYTTADGLVDNRVGSLQLMGDDLLIGTAGGLTRFYWNRPDRAR